MQARWWKQLVKQGWTIPACFDNDEWKLWMKSACDVRDGSPIPSPCLDCRPKYAELMKSFGKCQGEPVPERALSFGYHNPTGPRKSHHKVEETTCSV